MPDFKILKVEIDKAINNGKIYFRVERVGSSTWAGDTENPYSKKKIASRHLGQVERKQAMGRLPTPLDLAAAYAETIDVENLFIDGLQDTTLKYANTVRNSIVAEFTENNTDWRERLLNVYFGLGEK